MIITPVPNFLPSDITFLIVPTDGISSLFSDLDGMKLCASSMTVKKGAISSLTSCLCLNRFSNTMDTIALAGKVSYPLNTIYSFALWK